MLGSWLFWKVKLCIDVSGDTGSEAFLVSRRAEEELSTELIIRSVFLSICVSARCLFCVTGERYIRNFTFQFRNNVVPSCLIRFLHVY
jgi:hypothetical protein